MRIFTGSASPVLHGHPAFEAKIRDLLAAGQSKFYEQRDGRRWFFDLAKHSHVPEIESPKAIHLPRLHRANRIVRSNSGASLADLGDGVACLEFHVKMNVIGGDQLGLLRESLEEVRKNFAGLVIGNQGQHFSAGANLLLLTTQMQNQDWEEIDLMIRVFQKATSTLRQFEKPVVAACHGYTLGGGCELAMLCDMIVAGDDAQFGQPEINLGLIPGFGGTQRLTRLVGAGRAFDLLLSGRQISAAEALSFGLVNRVVPAAELMPAALAFAAELAGKAPVAVRYIIEAVTRGADMPLAEAQSLEATLFGLVSSTSDMREGTAAFLEKRKPTFNGR